MTRWRTCNNRRRMKQMRAGAIRHHWMRLGRRRYLYVEMPPIILYSPAAIAAIEEWFGDGRELET